MSILNSVMLQKGNSHALLTLVEMRSMMHEHLSLTTAEAVSRLKGDWAADIAAYDKVHEQILKMADMLSMGIVKQNGPKFK